MKSYKTIEEFFEEHLEWNTELQFLVSITKETDLQAAIKWGAPTYTVNRKNVISLVDLKQYIGLWFHQGVFLKDEQKVLHNAQEDVIKTLLKLSKNENIVNILTQPKKH